MFTCRICRNFIAKCSIYHEDNNWFDKYRIFLNIKVEEDLLEPKQLCECCKQELNRALEFKNICLESEKFWKAQDVCKSSEELSLITQEKSLVSNEDNGNEFDQSYVNTTKSVNRVTIQKKTKDVIEDEEQFHEFIRKLENGASGSEGSTDQGLDLHIDKILAGECGNCGKEYNTGAWLEKHVRKCGSKVIHTAIDVDNEDNKQPSPTNLECGICEWNSSDGSLGKHLRQHYKSNDLNCQLCDFVGKDFAEILFHRCNHITGEENVGSTILGKMQCILCTQHCFSALRLEYHFRKVHLNKKGGLCHYCDKEFSSFKVWKHHLRLHETEGFKCDLCCRRFPAFYLYSAHLKTHTQVRSFVCDLCGAAFKRRATLTYHIRREHQDMRPVHCDHCNKTFKNQERLDFHLKNLVRDRPHKCPDCEKTFTLFCFLKDHMQKHASGKPHPCDVCGKTFKWKNHLSKHKLQHNSNGEQNVKLNVDSA